MRDVPNVRLWTGIRKPQDIKGQINVIVMYNRVIIVANCCVYVLSTLCLVNAQSVQSLISGLL